MNPEATIAVTANIEIVFGFENASLYLGKVRKDESVNKTAYLVAKDPAALKLDGLTSSSDFIAAKVVDQAGTNTADHRIPVEITLSPGFPPGRINQKVRAKSTVDTLPEASLRVSGTIVGDVEVSPESVRFTIMKNAGDSVVPESRKLTITNHSDSRTLHVSSVSDPDDRLELDLRTIQAGRTFELIVRPKDASSITRTVNGTMTIVTDHPEQKELTVRYTLTPQS